MSSRQEHRIKAGITTGDINGIGMEIIIKTLADKRILNICTPVVYGSSEIASYYMKTMSIKDFNFNIISSADNAKPEQSNIINCLEDKAKVEIGKSTDTAGRYAGICLDMAVKDLKNKKTDVLITAPINKHSMMMNNFEHPGHTEYLSSEFGVKNTLMLMIGNNLRVATVTGHSALCNVVSSLSKEKIFDKIQLLNKTLVQDLGICKPKIAVLSINPHAGDGGAIGNEEHEIIVPAIQKAKEENILADGPFSADGLFGSSHHKDFDAILSMYHDQGLIPFKILSFGTGVNYTAGLPVIRTSPAHGTAYDIAGKNKASPSSFREAVYLACKIYRTRKAR